MIRFVYQNSPKGTGDAVLKTKNYIKDKFFLMLLPDDLIINKNCSMDMIKIYNKNKCSVMASMNVPKSSVSRWGIYSVKKKINKFNFSINDVIEKPSVRNAPSNKALFDGAFLTEGFSITSLIEKLNLFIFFFTEYMPHLLTELLGTFMLAITEHLFLL